MNSQLSTTESTISEGRPQTISSPTNVDTPSHCLWVECSTVSLNSIRRVPRRSLSACVTVCTASSPSLSSSPSSSSFHEFSSFCWTHTCIGHSTEQLHCLVQTSQQLCFTFPFVEVSMPPMNFCSSILLWHLSSNLQYSFMLLLTCPVRQPGYKYRMALLCIPSRPALPHSWK